MVRHSNRFILAIWMFNSLSSPAQPTEATAEVLNADATYREAVVRGDVDKLAAVFADDVLIINSDGTMDTKANFLNAISSGRLKMQTYERSHVQVRVFGSVAVLFSQTKKVFTYQNTPGVDVDLSTITYLKQAPNGRSS
jgi:ketosteroid isomerase-like protein